MAVTILLFILVKGLALVQGVSGKYCAQRMDGTGQASVFTFTRCLICTVIAVAVAGFTGAFSQAFSTNTLIWGIVGGASTALTFYTSVLALSMGGSMSTMSVFGEAGMILSIGYAWSFLGEPWSPFNIVGILLIIVAVGLMVLYNNRLNMSLSKKDIIRVVILGALSFLGNGMIMVAQKLFTVTEPSGNVGMFNMWMFLSGAALIVPIVLTTTKARPQFGFLKKIWLPLIFMSGAVFAISQIITMLAFSIPTAILFPTSTGVGLILTAVVAAIFFKERITVFSAIGIVLAIVGIVLLFI